MIKGRVPAGAVLEEDAPRDLPYPRLDPDLPGVSLAGEQVAAGVGHSGTITRLRISPDKRIVVSVGSEGAIFIWHMFSP